MGGGVGFDVLWASWGAGQARAAAPRVVVRSTLRGDDVDVFKAD
jgi:hypothetical protein